MYESNEDNIISHPVIGTSCLEVIRPIEQVDARQPIKINFVASTEGMYQIVMSNEYSWYKPKRLAYRVSVLRPIAEQKHE